MYGPARNSRRHHSPAERNDALDARIRRRRAFRMPRIETSTAYCLPFPTALGRWINRRASSIGSSLDSHETQIRTETIQREKVSCDDRRTLEHSCHQRQVEFDRL